jgi:F-type H+-transporting ATPase subunit epsilon
MGILVDIVTPERRLLSEEVDMVVMPGSAGVLGVLRGHTPLLTTLDLGEIALHKQNNVRYIAITGGVAEVRPSKVTILADTAERAEDIDVRRAEAARERARESVEKGGSGKFDPNVVAALRRSNLRLKVASKRRTQHRNDPLEPTQ